MNKRVLIIIGLIAMLTASAGAAPSIFDAMYWVKGGVTQVDDGVNPLSALAGKRVVFYRTLPGGFVETNPFGVSGNDGKYVLNIYDEAALLIDPSVPYYAAVAKDADGYGADPVPVTISGRGFEIADLSIEYGKGPQLPLDGAIQLTISRQGNDIKISWDPAQEAGQGVPQLYKILNIELSSNQTGAGVYVNDGGQWEPVTVNSAGLYKFDYSKAVSEHYILQKDQVGQGYREFYYKALRGDITAITQPTKPIIESAWAVGKYDVPVYRDPAIVKYTRLSIPFVLNSQNWNDVIGPQLTANTTAAYADQLLEWNGTQWNALYYRSPQEGWLLLGGVAAFGSVFGEGYAVRVPGRANQTESRVTMVGNVKVDQFKIADTFKNIALDKYTIFAQPFPKLKTMNEANFNGYGNTSKAYADQILKWTGSDWVAIYLSGTNDWQPMDAGKGGFDLKPGIGYTYRKGDGNTSLTGFNWTLDP